MEFLALFHSWLSALPNLMLGVKFHFSYSRNPLSLVKQNRYKSVCYKIYFEICIFWHKNPLRLILMKLWCAFPKVCLFCPVLVDLAFSYVYLFLRSTIWKSYLLTITIHGLMVERHSVLVRTSDTYSPDSRTGSRDLRSVLFCFPSPPNIDVHNNICLWHISLSLNSSFTIMLSFDTLITTAFLKWLLNKPIKKT
jgi:hypothetical protein